MPAWLTSSGCGLYASRVDFLRCAHASANAPAANDVKPKIGPLSEPPVNGSEPVRGPAPAVTPVEDETVGALVVVRCATDPSVTTGVLDDVVDRATVVFVTMVVVGASVVLVSIVVDDAPVVLVGGTVDVVVDVDVLVLVDVLVDVLVLVLVDVLVLVVVVDPGHVDESQTEVENVDWNVSDHVTCTLRETLPVDPPGTVVCAEVVPLAPTVAV